MRMLRDSVAEVTITLKKQKNKGQAPLVCAVPLRGCGFEIMARVVRNSRELFPSPCGDVVWNNGKVSLHSFWERVSVPLRGCGFEMAIMAALELNIVDVSVPLRGCDFEIRSNSDVPLERPIVSVPLRGYGFEIRLSGTWITPSLECFRPLAGIWFWNLTMLELV